MDKTIYEAVKTGVADNNIRYTDFQKLIIALGFKFLRQKGSHTMYFNSKINAFINIQKDGKKAKAYQVKQLREIILNYNL